MSRMECSVTDGPASEDDSHFQAPQEQDPDEAYDQQRADEDYAELKTELLKITRLQSVTAEIERLTKSLQNSLLRKRQGE